MALSLIGIPSRIAFFVCGIVAIFLGNAYRMFRPFDPTLQGTWLLLSIALIAVGGFAVVLALLPTSWLTSLFKIESRSERFSLVPIKMLGVFAVFSYLWTAALYFAPHGWHPAPPLVYSYCPACVLTITVDPSFSSVLMLLAPLDAAVYGSLGAVSGCTFIAIRNHRCR